MYKCEICGREVESKMVADKKVVCGKHAGQWSRYRKFLDSNPRHRNMMNDYRIEGDTAIFNLYNRASEKIGEFKVDAFNAEKVKDIHWHRSSSGYISTNAIDGKKKRIQLHNYLLPLSEEELERGLVVDHINSQKNDCRLSNLRKCTQSHNRMNSLKRSDSSSGFTGVHYSYQSKNWIAEITKFGTTSRFFIPRATKKIAVYARLVAEEILFDEFFSQEQRIKKMEFTQDLPEETKREIEQRVKTKLIDKGLI